MIPVLDQHRAEIAALCRQFHVLRLDLFGSAAREVDFDPARSDVDLLVTFDPAARPSAFEHLRLRTARDVLGALVSLAGAAKAPGTSR